MHVLICCLGLTNFNLSPFFLELKVRFQTLSFWMHLKLTSKQNKMTSPPFPKKSKLNHPSLPLILRPNRWGLACALEVSAWQNNNRKKLHSGRFSTLLAQLKLSLTKAMGSPNGRVYTSSWSSIHLLLKVRISW